MLPFPADAKMAATVQPKKSAKIIWRTCMLCSTRLSEFCYDTHTLCEACRGQVCSSDSFCKECESWSDDFRKLYLRHKNSLLMKRVSKKNRKEGRSKDKSPLQVDVAPPQVDDPPHSVDDATSTASQESHVTSPVVMMPLNQDLMAANLTVEQFQTFQHVDNVVEVQLQPVPSPPQSTTVVDSSFFDRVTNMMNTFDKLVPLLTNLGSDRRSPTAGPSDIVSPNPIARVPDSASQGPVLAPQSQDVAPRPSSASSEPRASSSGLQQRRQDKFASPRGQPNEGDKSRRSRHASPSLQHRLRRQLDDVHRQLDNAKEIVDLYHAQSRVPPDQARYDLEILQDRYAQLSIALEESLASTSFHSHGPSPTSHGIASPSVDPLAPLRGSPGLDRPRSPYRFSSRSEERYEQQVAYSDAPAHRRRPRSRESHPSRELDFPSKSPSPYHSSSRDRFSTDLPFQRRSTSRRSSSPRRTQSPTKRRVASRRTPSPAQRRVASRRTPSPAQRRVASRRTPSPAQRRVASRRTPSPVQRRVASRRTSSPTQRRVTSQLTPSPTQRRVASKGSPPPKWVAGDPGAGPSSARRPLSRDSRSPKRSSRESLSPKRGSPSPKRQRYEARDSVSPPPLHSSRASSREPSQERPHSRSSPTRPASPSREEEEADEIPIPATVKAMVDFITSNFPDATASPAHKSSRSFDLRPR